MKIKNTATGEVRQVSTNGEGVYSAPNLLPGPYEVEVGANGFRTVLQKGLNLTVGVQQSLNIKLAIGNVAETVEVTDAPPAVETNSSAKGNVREGNVDPQGFVVDLAL